MSPAKISSVIKPICPHCFQTLVPCLIFVNRQKFTTYLCQCTGQPVSADEIKAARKTGETLVYSIEVANGQ